MRPKAYADIERHLEVLRSLAPESLTFAPLFSENRLAAAVDDLGRIHAVRILGETTGAGGGPGAERLEYAILDVPAWSARMCGLEPPPPPVWRSLSDVFSPQNVSIIAAGSSAIVGVVAATPEAARTAEHPTHLRRDLFVMRPGVDNVLRPTGLGRVHERPSVAVAPSGEIVALGRKWRPNVALMIRAQLKVSWPGLASPFFEPVPGTENIFAPDDYALHVTPDATAHIVVQGAPKVESEYASHLFHLTLRSDGTVSPVHDLGQIPERALLTEIFTDAKGSAYCLLVQGARGTGSQMFGRVIRLGDSSQPVAGNERYFIDHWMQLHVVWFENGVPKYYGPEAVVIE